jgi:REP element-mobilizing transposase RayT
MNGQKPAFERKRNRLKHYDYSANGYYFVTICVQDRRCLFGRISPEAREVELSHYGQAVLSALEQTMNVFEGVEIPEYTVMPNHVHMIISLYDQHRTLSQIVNYFKGCVSRKVDKRIWQRSFYDHVIRNDSDYSAIVEYIRMNPCVWAVDMYYNEDSI